MPRLPSKNDCCGCSACIDSCKQGALSLIEDDNGYFYPLLESSKCIDCNVCENKCHIIHQERIRRSNIKNIEPYAAWTTDETIIKGSASGGIFAQIAHDFLKTPNSYVYGAAFDNNSDVKIIEICDIKDIPLLQGSKYQQSEATGIYNKVLKRLRNGSRVLFSGLPCQIGALYGYLPSDEAIISNLFSIEVICHGVPSNIIGRLAIKLNKAERIHSYRTKSKGWLCGNRVVYKMQDGALLEMPNRLNDFWFRTYLSFSFSRKNCYQCKYATINRVADLTIGDFWGYNESPRAKDYYNYMGTSLVITNTIRGKDLILGSLNIYTKRILWEECLPFNQNLYMPTNRYIFKGASFVKIIKKFPPQIQKIVFQNGFTNYRLNYYYNRLFNFVYNNIRKRKDQVIKDCCQKTIKKLVHE